MATLEEIYADVLNDDAEKQALAEACGSTEGIQSFLSARDCEATVEELAAFLADKGALTSEFSEDDLAGAAAGGTCCNFSNSLANMGTCFTLSLIVKPKTPNSTQMTCE